MPRGFSAGFASSASVVVSSTSLSIVSLLMFESHSCGTTISLSSSIIITSVAVISETDGACVIGSIRFPLTAAS